METKGGYLITQVKQVGSRVFERILNEANISEFNGAQGKILYVLWQKDGLSMSAIARKTGLANTTLTSMVDRLEESGLVRREPHGTDRRKTVIYLTDRAYALQYRYDAVSQKMNELYYVGFSEKEIRQFEDYLYRILDNLENASNSFRR